MNINCTYRISFIDNDNLFDFYLGGVGCIINSKQLADITILVAKEFLIMYNYCELTFYDVEKITWYIEIKKINQLQNIIRNRKLNQLINE